MALKADLPVNDVWFAGDSHQIEIALTEEGEPLVLTGYEAVFTAKLNKKDADNAPTTIQKTVGNGIEIIDTEDIVDGAILISLDASDTKDLTEDTTYFWDLQLSIDDEPFTAAYGTVKFNYDITQI